MKTYWLKIIGILTCLYGLFQTCNSWMSFTYFTVLSNVLVLIVLTYFLWKNIKKEKISKKWYLIRFFATVHISLTFSAFLLLLAPTYPGGVIKAYMDFHMGSFCLHFIAPLCMIFDFLLNDKDFKLEKKHIFYALFPVLLYLFYLLILAFFGVRWNGMMAPYNFINYGAPTGWFGFDLSLMGFETLGIGVSYMIVILCFLILLVGFLFYQIHEKIVAKK